MNFVQDLLPGLIIIGALVYGLVATRRKKVIPEATKEEKIGRHVSAIVKLLGGG